MTLIVLTSASGSPGVTTAALGLALTWARPSVLVEADPTGGSAILAGYLRGTVTPPESLIDLALAHRDGALTAAIPRATMLLPGSTVSLVAGTRSHEQAGSLLALWEPLAAALKALDHTGQDAIVDAGRLGLFGSPEPIIYGSDLTVLVTRSDLVSLSGARSWAETLRAEFDRVGAAANLGALLIGEGAPYRAREVATVLRIPVVAALAWDPDAAAVLSVGASPPKPGLIQRLAGADGLVGSALLRSVHAARTTVEDLVAANRERLAASPTRRRA